MVEENIPLIAFSALQSSQVGPSPFSQPPAPDYFDIQDTLRSIQAEQVSLRAFVASESTALRDFVQERHDELLGCLFPRHNISKTIGHV